MNGDDGYADAGGGGSVWCDFHVSEVDREPEWDEVQQPGGSHRPRKKGHDAYAVKTGVVDKYTEHRKGDDVKGHGPLPDDNHPLIKHQGHGYFVLTVDNASQIQRIEIDGDTLRVYVPIVNPPDHQKARQVSLRWGLRVFGEGDGVPGMWTALKVRLLGTPGVADVTRGVSVEKKSAASASR